MSNQQTNYPPTGRWLEAGLLLIACLIGSFAFFAIIINRTGNTQNLLMYLFGAILGCTVLHLLVRWLTPYADPIILPIAVCLNSIGLAMIYRLQLSYEYHPCTKNCPDANKQALITLFSLVLMAIMLYVFSNYKVLRKYSYTFMVASLILLLLPLMPLIGTTKNGARIWINIGFSIQPGEIAKICLAIFFAGYLCSARDQLVLGGKKIFGITFPRFKDLGPLVIVWLISILILVFEKDLGTSLLIFGFFVAMLYVATNQSSWLIIGFFAFTPAVYLAAKLFQHVQVRINTWLHPFDQNIYNAPRGSSYQLVQGLFGMSDGGILGTGWAQGSPIITPVSNADFIYTALAEELGLVGVFAILILYLIFAQRGFKIAVECTDNFGKLLALGLSFTIAFQIFVTVGGVIRVIPSTGLALPFLAEGGSALVANWLIVAMLLRISDNTRRPNRGLADIQLQTTVINRIIAKQEEKVAEEREEREEKAQAQAATVAVTTAQPANPCQATIQPLEPKLQAPEDATQKVNAIDNKDLTRPVTPPNSSENLGGRE